MIIDDTILDQITEDEFNSRKKIFSIVNDALASEMVMQNSMECYDRIRIKSKIISFPYIIGSVQVDVQSIKVKSEITKKMWMHKEFDNIDIELSRMGKELGYKFNDTILGLMIGNLNRENEVMYDRHISLVGNLQRCKQKVDAVSVHKVNIFGDSPDKIILYSNGTFRFINDLEISDLEFDVVSLFIVYNKIDVGTIAKTGLILDSFDDDVMYNLDKMEASIRYAISINKPEVISVLKVPLNR